MAIDACEAGKDIYLQKPMTLHLAESLAVKAAVKKHKRISQVGTQIHAGENYHRVVDHVRSGNLGKIGVARTFNMLNMGVEGVGNDPNCDVPAGARLGTLGRARADAALPSDDHQDLGDPFGLHGLQRRLDALLGPAHHRPARLGARSGSCRRWSVRSGGRYVCRDAGDAYDTQETMLQYPGLHAHLDDVADQLLPASTSRGDVGIYFHGVNGTLYADYGTHQIVPEGDRMKDAKEPEKSVPDSPGHEREWLDCIRSRTQPSCNVFYHHKVNVPIVLGNLSLKLGRSIRFDPATEKIVGDEEAAALAVPEYRHALEIPDAIPLNRSA